MARPFRLVGTVHIFRGPKKSNPFALYARQEGEELWISPEVQTWKHIVGKGPTINKAAGNFDINWKAQGLPADEYSGPHWESGIRAEKPPPPKPAAAATVPSTGTPAGASAPSPAVKPASPAPSKEPSQPAEQGTVPPPKPETPAP